MGETAAIPFAAASPGRYRVIGLLGRGGMGEVYRATDLTLAQPVTFWRPQSRPRERAVPNRV